MMTFAIAMIMTIRIASKNYDIGTSIWTLMITIPMISEMTIIRVRVIVFTIIILLIEKTANNGDSDS